MSELSVLKNDVVADLGKVASWFESFTSPNTQAGAASIASQLKQAASAAEALLPSLANDATNAVLAMIPGGAEYEAYADQLIDKVIANLTAKKSTPAA
jgi:uncharacterized protein Yka (UPF0111/DUF47 family)